jgi:BlaI family transcriptional regulator, penicillinase repressor
LFVRKISYLRVMKKEKGEMDKKAEPTRSELEILQVLWKHGPSTVRFVNDTLNEEKRAVQYTSTLKLMQIMVEKEILQRDESAMKHVYSAAIEEHQFKGFLLERFVDSLYDGSATSLMMQLLGNKKTSRQELDQIRDLLDKVED